MTPKPPRRPNAIELAFRQAQMSPEQRLQSQAEFRARMERFGPDFVKAIIPGAVSTLRPLEAGLTNFRGNPIAAAMPTRSRSPITDRLVSALQEMLGSDPQSEGGAIGQEIGQIGATVLPMIPGVQQVVGRGVRGLTQGVGRMSRRPVEVDFDVLTGRALPPNYAKGRVLREIPPSNPVARPPMTLEEVRASVARPRPMYTGPVTGQEFFDQHLRRLGLLK